MTFSSTCPPHIKGQLAIFLVFLLFCTVFPTNHLVFAQGEEENAKYYSIKLTVTYVNPSEGTRTWNFTEEDRTINLFMNNAWQSVELKSTDYPLESRKKDIDGNSIAVLKFPEQQISPGQNMSFSAEYRVVSKQRIVADISEDESESLDTIPNDLKENYSRGEGSWLVTDTVLQGLAHEIAGAETNVLKIVRNLVEWIKSNISYTTHEVPLYPNETFDIGEGDCDDQAILFITLSRIIGIPCHLQIGTLYMLENSLSKETYWDGHVQVVQRRIGWHGWAIVYVPPWGWLPVDLTFADGVSIDPLNSIRNAAVTQQYTIQYMNFSKVDYVATSLQARAFLLENGFFVVSEDEMTEVAENGFIGRFDPTVAVVLIIIVVMILASSFLIARRWRRRPEEPEVTTAGSSQRPQP